MEVFVDKLGGNGCAQLRHGAMGTRVRAGCGSEAAVQFGASVGVAEQQTQQDVVLVPCWEGADPCLVCLAGGLRSGVVEGVGCCGDQVGVDA